MKNQGVCRLSTKTSPLALRQAKPGIPALTTPALAAPPHQPFAAPFACNGDSGGDSGGGGDGITAQRAVATRGAHHQERGGYGGVCLWQVPCGFKSDAASAGYPNGQSRLSWLRAGPHPAARCARQSSLDQDLSLNLLVRRVVAFCLDWLMSPSAWKSPHLKLYAPPLRSYTSLCGSADLALDTNATTTSTHAVFQCAFTFAS